MGCIRSVTGRIRNVAVIMEGVEAEEGDIPPWQADGVCESPRTMGGTEDQLSRTGMARRTAAWRRRIMVRGAARGIQILAPSLAIHFASFSHSTDRRVA
jgi:hypothetical protein